MNIFKVYFWIWGETIEIDENMFFVICCSNQGLIWCFSNREEKVSMCHFKNCWGGKYIWGSESYGGPKMILKWCQNDPKIVLKWLPPFPSPASAKVSCQGGKQIRNKIHCWWVFYNFYKQIITARGLTFCKKHKLICFQVLSK